MPPNPATPAPSCGMFGTLRYVLAMMVMLSHLAPIACVHLGIYAVFGFFILSGYLMCTVLRTRYFRQENGIRNYYVNRFLRVYPVYWVVLAFSLALLLVVPVQAVQVHERMQLPGTFNGWVANVLIFGLTGLTGLRSDHNPVPPAWSLAVELSFWLLLPWLVQSRARLAGWGAFALAYTALVICRQENLYLRYYSPLAAALPFFLGAALGALQVRGTVAAPAAFGMLAVLIAYYAGAPYLFGSAAVPFGDAAHLFTGLYAATAINLATVIAFARVPVAGVPKPLLRMDRFLGDISYPIFLVHILAAVVAKTLWPWLPPRSWALVLAALPDIHLFSILLWYGVDRYIQTLRIPH